MSFGEGTSPPREICAFARSRAAARIVQRDMYAYIYIYTLHIFLYCVYIYIYIYIYIHNYNYTSAAPSGARVSRLSTPDVRAGRRTLVITFLIIIIIIIIIIININLIIIIICLIGLSQTSVIRASVA